MTDRDSHTTDTEKAEQALAHYQKGLKLIKEGNPQAAFEALGAAVHMMPDEPMFRLQLAMTANHIANQSDPLREIAFNNAMHVCKMFPERLDFWIALGEIAVSAKKYHDAVAAFERALSFDEKNSSIWCLLGFANERVGNQSGAMECYRSAVHYDPENGQPHIFLSIGYNSPEFFDPEKLAYHAERAFKAKKPATGSIIESYWNAAHGYLNTGDYEKGWSYFEARLQRNVTNAAYRLPSERFKKTMWKGERNKRVLITAEMGFGDSFIMARFLPIIQERFNFKLLLECAGPTIDLMRASFPGVKCILSNEISEDDFDHHIPFMSLPHVCRIKSSTVPNTVPYLRPSDAKEAEWGLWAAQEIRSDGPRIGICWAGGSRSYNAQNHQTDKRRSLSYEKIKPLLDIPGINWVSLQAEGAPPEFKLHDDARTFEDTAAIMSHLDAVVSVDTAIINLAGAMGKLSWCLSRHDHCWRWCDKLKTPWYPTVKVIKQPRMGMWEPVLEQISRELITFRDNMAG